MPKTKATPARLAPWWKALLARDAAYVKAWQRNRDDYEVEIDEPNSLMSCIFCGKNLTEPIVEAALGDLGGPMLAYWQDNESIIQFSGLYCLGRVRGCLAAAEIVDCTLGDGHAMHAAGKKAMRHLKDWVFDLSTWEPSALRRFVMIHMELAALKVDG